MSSSHLTKLAVLVLATRSAYADPACRVVDIDFTPSDELQIVAWVEKADGTFLDTIYITKKTGFYGLGNRPGRYDFNSGPLTHDLWPYGRRITTFPVWAHRHGKSWPEIEFQNNSDSDLSHPFNESTPEMTYCMPMGTDDQGWDTGTCATAMVGTDKGTFSATATSQYPPRADWTRVCGTDQCDSPSVAMYQQMNPFDAITQATPTGGTQTEISWPIPQDLPAGDYVVWIEASKAFDYNSTYNATTYPGPSGIPYGSRGVPYRGQPSVVYSVQFTMGTTATITATQTYSGYGDPSGATGMLHAPDATITTDTPASGASRLQILAGSSGDLVRVCARPEMNTTPPSPISGLAVAAVSSSSAMIQFVAPLTAMKTCSGEPSKVAGYEVRYRANDEMTADNFADSMLAPVAMVPATAGQLQSFEVDGLLPTTDYWVGIRAYDDCRNYSDLAIIALTTTERQSGEVDACFVATAAYGSLMANDVEMLRSFRDSVLRSTVFGELAVEAYYTFGPSVAGVVGESELLRATARGVLSPIIAVVRTTRF